MVNKAIIEANGKELKEDIIKKYKKLKTSELAREEFCRKGYLYNVQCTLKSSYISIHVPIVPKGCPSKNASSVN